METVFLSISDQNCGRCTTCARPHTTQESFRQHPVGEKNHPRERRRDEIDGERTNEISRRDHAPEEDGGSK